MCIRDSYQVGDMKNDGNGNFHFEFTDRFAASEASGGDLSAVFSAEGNKKQAAIMAQYAEKNKLRGETKQIGSDGRAEFKNLSAGLYLIIQETAAKGYYKISPFLISVPYKYGERYYYSVNSEPKLQPIPSDPDDPDDTDDPDDPDNPDNPDDPPGPDDPDNPDDPDAVSYTHLDVYKRQLSSSIATPITNPMKTGLPRG